MPLDPLSILAGQLATQVVALAKAALDAHIGGGPAQRARRGALCQAAGAILLA
jgi:hypothetical protein